jgi:uncharacterized protein (DUF362 family)
MADEIEGPDRRAVLGGFLGAASLAVGGSLTYNLYRQPMAQVTVLRHREYDEGLAAHLVEGLKRYPHIVARAKGGRVVLKPNFVEFHVGRPINTDVRFVAAAIEAFRRVGAAEVLVGEGPGHLRDTEYLLEATGLDAHLRDLKARFVDLNVDDGHAIDLPNDETGFGRIHFAKTAVTADLLVSLAKMKTHHWAGATLTMKNMFGIVPSAIYGWPKNPLHWKGIHQSIFDIWDSVRPGFGMIDGIIAMEGDGPIMGTPKPFGAVIMGDNLPAVDAHTCRLMGIIPEKMAYLSAASKAGGTIHPWRIEALGDAVSADPFHILDHLSHLRA